MARSRPSPECVRVTYQPSVGSGLKRAAAHVRLGSWLCENAKTLNRDRRSYSSKTVLVAQRASGFNLEIGLKNIILRRVSIFEFLHSQGQELTWHAPNRTSALPLKADSTRTSRHFRFVANSRRQGEGRKHYAAFFAPLRERRKRPSRWRLLLRGIRSMSLTSLAPPLRRSSTILRLWNASSSTRWATLTMVAFGSSLMTISIILSWLFSSSAEVASSSTTMSGLWSNRPANASRCFSPPESVWSHGPSSSIFSLR